MRPKSNRPPWFAQAILKMLLKESIEYSALGDLEEQYNLILNNEGRRKARLYYWREIIPVLKAFFKPNLIWRMNMFRNYLKVFMRTLFRQKMFSLITISGLAVGIACSILIYLKVSHEVNYDDYHQDADRIYRIAQKIKLKAQEGETARVSAPLTPTLRRSFPQVEDAARFQFLYYRSLVRRHRSQFYEKRVMVAENNIFNVLTIPFVRGSKENALLRSRTVVITRSMAERYFGEENPIGKILEFWGRAPLEVTGVIADAPKNTHLKYNFIVSLKTFEKSWNMENWGWTGFYTYIKLRPQVNPQVFGQKIAKIADKYIPEKLEKWGQSFTFYLQPLKKIHLHSHLKMEIEEPGNLFYITIFSLAGFMIMLIVGFNFVNLSTAGAVKRVREIGIRKVVGARRRELFRQFLGESLIISFLALIVAVIVTLTLLSSFNVLANTGYEPGDIFKPKNLFIFVAFTLFVGLAAGTYPAFYLSRLNPQGILKGMGMTSHPGGGGSLRKLLVVGQFAITIIFIFITLMAAHQIRFMKNMELGFKKEQKVIVEARVRNNYQMVKAEFLKHPAITGTTVCWSVPGRLTNTLLAKLTRGGNTGQSMHFQYVDYDFIPEYGLQIIAGRNFRKASEQDKVHTFILNEEAVHAFGYRSPGDILGKEMYEGGSSQIGRIIGVVKNFHFKGVQNPIEPLIFQYNPRYFDLLSLTVNSQHIDEALAFIKKKWQELHLGAIFNYNFLNQEFNQLYGNEEKTHLIFQILTLLAGFLACLGLTGLASYMTEQRTKEMGIRKVLGSSTGGILVRFTGEFFKWVFFANLIAWPIGLYLIKKWLQNFAYPANMSPWIFLSTVLIVFGITLLTVGYQCLRVASRHPVNSLRYE